ncbi:hypothetical protein [Teichococcus aestuarii]
MTHYFAPAALLPTGWARDVRIETDGAGSIATVTPGAIRPERNACRAW